jgi:hypothetical protein
LAAAALRASVAHAEVNPGDAAEASDGRAFFRQTF